MPDEYREGITRLGEQYDLVTHGKVTDDLKRAYVERADPSASATTSAAASCSAARRRRWESQIRAAIGAGATNFDGAIDADLDEHRRRIGAWAALVLPRFGRGVDG